MDTETGFHMKTVMSGVVLALLFAMLGALSGCGKAIPHSAVSSIVADRALSPP
jgi:hypothetical protein